MSTNKERIQAVTSELNAATTTINNLPDYPNLEYYYGTASMYEIALSHTTTNGYIQGTRWNNYIIYYDSNNSGNCYLYNFENNILTYVLTFNSPKTSTGYNKEMKLLSGNLSVGKLYFFSASGAAGSGSTFNYGVYSLSVETGEVTLIHKFNASAVLTGVVVVDDTHFIFNMGYDTPYLYEFNLENETLTRGSSTANTNSRPSIFQVLPNAYIDLSWGSATSSGYTSQALVKIIKNGGSISTQKYQTNTKDYLRGCNYTMTKIFLADGIYNLNDDMTLGNKIADYNMNLTSSYRLFPITADLYIYYQTRTPEPTSVYKFDEATNTFTVFYSNYYPFDINQYANLGTGTTSKKLTVPVASDVAISFELDNKCYAIGNSKPITSDKILTGNSAFDGNMQEVVGSMPNNGTIDITPSTSQQTIPDGYTSGGTVQAVTAAIDNNIVAENIKDGVEILGVIGTLQGGTYQSKSLEITQNNSTNQITPDTGYNALSSVEVEVNVDAVMTNSDYNTALDLADDILGEEEPQPSQAVVYGIKRLLSSTSPTWIRTDDSENMVANATIGGIEGTNDFDTAEIYKNIITQNYNTTTKQVIAEYGDQNFTFSPSDNDIKVMTYIPEFWAKRWQDNDYEYIQITNQATTGFIHIPSRRIGRYTTGGTSSVPTIKSGQAPLVNITLPNLRTVAKSINTDITLMDIWTWNILQILFLVEYASYNSQDKLGRGYVDGNSSALASGGCDNLGMKSGCVTNDGKHAVIYRGVENIFGNIYQWLDGINFVGRQGYVCTNYTQYASDTTTNYVQLGYVCPSNDGYIGNLGYDSNSSLVMIPSAVGGSGTSGITDYYYRSNSGNRVSYVGGDWSSGSKAGSFYLRADDVSAAAGSNFGGRFVQYDSTAI